MDSVTHVVVGAIIGDVLLGNKMGRKAMLYGAAFQSIPDLDFIATFWLDPVSDLIAHRGITHSFIFAIVITPIVALLCKRINPAYHISYGKWAIFVGLEILIHLFLDAFNAYGTGWFEPFSTARVSFNSIFVLDPLFSILPIIAFFVLLFTPRTFRGRRWWSTISLGSMAIYLSISVISKLIVYDEVKEIAVRKDISYDRHFTTPTHFNIFLWLVVLENDSGYNVGYRSLFDTRPDIDFHFFPRNEHLLTDERFRSTINKLKVFSDGFYTAEMRQDTLVFNALRFGQQVGWNNPSAPFAFYYNVNYPDDNEIVVQRGRFAGWDQSVFRSLLRRIAGR